MAYVIVRRLVLILLTLVVSSLLIFAAAQILPADPGRNILGQFAPQSAVDSLNRELGQDKPIPERYLAWVGDAVHGDFGTSVSKGGEVAPLILDYGLNTAILAGLAFTIIVTLALLLGVLAGVFADRAPDRIISLGSLITASTPEFVAGVLLLWLFAIKLQWLPGSSLLVTESNPLQAPDKLVLPVMTLVLVDVGYIARMTRASMIDVMRAPYIRAARLKGLTTSQVVTRHALRNALLVPITVSMLHLNWLVGGIVVTEVIFSYPGLGQLMLSAATAKDLPLLAGGALIFALVAVLTQLIADLLYAVLNPRIRLAGS